MSKHKRLVRDLLSAVIAVIVLVPFGVADAQKVTQGYRATQPLQKGMVVRLKNGDKTQVEPLPKDDSKNMLGVVVAANESPVSLTDPTAERQVYVASLGQYDVLVSDQNGPIKKGGLVAVSSLNGIGMKADSTVESLIGHASQSFDGKSNVIGRVSLFGSQGEKPVNIGRIKVDVSTGSNPLFQQDIVKGVPDFMARAVAIVTDNPVSAIRVWVSFGVLILALFVAGIIIYAGVRTGMVSIGRNPLAKKHVMRNMIQVVFMALIVVVIGVIAVYLLLRL